MTKNQTLWNAAYILGAIALVVLLQIFWNQTELVRVVPYSELERELAAGRVERVVVSDREIRGYLKTADAQGKRIISANRMELDLAERLSRFNVPFTRTYSSGWLQEVLGWVLIDVRRGMVLPHTGNGPIDWKPATPCLPALMGRDELESKMAVLLGGRACSSSACPPRARPTIWRRRPIWLVPS